MKLEILHLTSGHGLFGPPDRAALDAAIARQFAAITDPILRVSFYRNHKASIDADFERKRKAKP